jgi:enoyl-CoA hydratase/carnithine racemase
MICPMSLDQNTSASGRAHPNRSSSDDDVVLCEVSDRVCLLTLNRPHRLNAMTPQLLESLADGIEAAERDPDTRVIVITGAGKGFCSGADLDLLAQGPEALDGFSSGFDSRRLFSVTQTMSTPVVIAVNGAAAGAGFVLSLIGDVRFASRSALFLSAFSRLGLTAEYAAAWLLPRIIAPGIAKEILLSGRPVTAEEAERIGLVSGIADDGLDLAMRWARDVAAHCSPASLAAMKSQFVHADDHSLDEHLTDSLSWMERSFRWPDLAIALAAREQSHPPEFPAARPPA